MDSAQKSSHELYKFRSMARRLQVYTLKMVSSPSLSLILEIIFYLFPYIKRASLRHSKVIKCNLDKQKLHLIIFVFFPIFAVFPQLLNIYIGDQDDIHQVLETGEYFEACWSLRSNHSHITSVVARYRCLGIVVQLQRLRIADNIQASVW